MRCRDTRGRVRVASQCVRRPRETCCNTRGHIRVASSTLLVVLDLARSLTETSSLDSASAFLYTLPRLVLFSTSQYFA